MNLQPMLLVGVLLGSNVATDIEYYENVYVEGHNQNQEKIYLERVEENPQDITALTELGSYYEKLLDENYYDFKYFEKAETVYKEILEINPKSTALAEFYVNVGNVMNYNYLDKDNNKVDIYKNAEEELFRLLDIDDKNIQTLTYLGDLYKNAYCDLGNYDDILDYSDFFDKTEKVYFDVLNIDENNVEARYKLIDLYEKEAENKEENAWRYDDYSEDIAYSEYFKKVEQQYLDILNANENYTQARYDLINFYEYAYRYNDVDCIDKIEKQFLEISKRESKEEYNIDIPIKIGDIFKDIWYSSDYTDNEAFDKAEYYYNYALSIEPENSDALYELIVLYNSDYYYRNNNSDENFKKLENLYIKYLPTVEAYEQSDVLFDLGCLYEDKWLLDKSDYTYYYMAEDEFYLALESSSNLDNNIYQIYDSLNICMYLVELCTAKYEFDGDTEAINNAKNLLLEQISTSCIDEVAYMNSDVTYSYVNKEKLEILGVLYYYLWELNTDDVQYYEKAEKTFLESLDSENDYWVLTKLTELYSDKYALDGDIESLNKSKDFLLEQISNAYSDYGTQEFYMDYDATEELSNLYYLVWKLDINDTQYYEKAEKVLLESLDASRSNYRLLPLGELYTERWLVDESDVQYKIKALECFDEILDDEDDLYYEFWLKGKIYESLEKLKL